MTPPPTILTDEQLDQSQRLCDAIAPGAWRCKAELALPDLIAEVRRLRGTDSRLERLAANVRCAKYHGLEALTADAGRYWDIAVELAEVEDVA